MQGIALDFAGLFARLFAPAVTGMGFFVFTAGAVSADTRVQDRLMLGGYLDVGRTTPYAFKPHAKPRPLPDADAGRGSEAANRRAVREIGAYVRRYPETLAVMLIDRGAVVHSVYHGAARAGLPLYSMSVAKSLTSLAVGKALCAGLIPSIDTRVSDLVPELGINNFGRSTVREVLTMSSGAWVSAFIGQPAFRGGIGRRPRTGEPYKGFGWPVRLGQVTVAGVLWGDAWRRIDNTDAHPPGRVFGYKAGDTLTAATVVARVSRTSLAGYFDRAVWRNVRGASRGGWEADREGVTVASSGAQFRLADWGRIASWVLAARSGRHCFGAYLRAATSTQVSTQRPGRRAHPHFAGYGYQWWTENRYAPGFWAVGYAGQYIAIDPDTRKILIKFGAAQYGRSARDLFELFARWTRTGELPKKEKR